MGDGKIEIEAFTKSDVVDGIGNLVEIAYPRQITKEYLLVGLAMCYKAMENNGKAAGRIAERLWPMREKSPEAQRGLIQYLLPEQQLFEKQFDEAVAAVEKSQWNKAARHLEKALALKLDYPICRAEAGKAPGCRLKRHQ